MNLRISNILVYWLGLMQIQISGLLIVSDQQNDLYQLLIQVPLDITRFDNVDEAILQAEESTSLIVLTSEITQQHYQEMDAKKLFAYVEMPEELPIDSWKTNVEHSPQYRFWAKNTLNLHPGSLLTPQAAMYYHYHFHADHKVLLMAGRVAGYDHLAFEEPSYPAFPVLFQLNRLVIGAFPLSRFIAFRMMPEDFFMLLIRDLFNIVCMECPKDIDFPPPRPLVAPSFTKHEPLPENAEKECFAKAALWIDQTSELVRHNETNGEYCPVDAYISGRSTSTCVLEGYSNILASGKQKLGLDIRTDCNGEITGLLAIAKVLQVDGVCSDTSAAILDYLWLDSLAQRGPRNDPSDPQFGQLIWVTAPELNYLHYSDNDARALLGSILASSLLQSSKWDQRILMNLFANLRVTGTHGFQPKSFNVNDLSKFGFQHFQQMDLIDYTSHYQSYIWALYFWAFEHTQYRPFLIVGEKALKIQMAGYSGNFDKTWTWTQTWLDELSHLILPLAYYVRVVNTDESKLWLYQVTQDIEKFLKNEGYLQEWLANPSLAQDARIPKSNKEYHSGEAPLLQKNGDPVADLLYSMDFAFIGLHEAYFATGNDYYRQLEDKMADFLIRAQTSSTVFPELSGTWYRAFDYNRWSYYASNSDTGWGPWAIESGWTHAWIGTTFGLRILNQSIWDITRKSTIGFTYHELSRIFTNSNTALD